MLNQHHFYVNISHQFSYCYHGCEQIAVSDGSVESMARTQLALHLISVSRAAGEPADCDLVFRLGDQETSDIPNPAQMSPWKGKAISPLRDRFGGGRKL